MISSLTVLAHFFFIHSDSTGVSCMTSTEHRSLSYPSVSPANWLMDTLKPDHNYKKCQLYASPTHISLLTYLPLCNFSTPSLGWMRYGRRVCRTQRVPRLEFAFLFATTGLTSTNCGFGCCHTAPAAHETKTEKF